ncbi:MAG: hypothetical protein KC418_23965 [Anaerolineales bacterium]|nr:hypothetical protein [Anaerolineales bacterium]
MKQPINLSQGDLDELGVRAEQLGEWLEEQEDALAKKRLVRIPPQLAVIASTAIVYGLPLILHITGPSSMCWGGECVG